MSHFGTVACVLAIYSPDSTEAERRLAEANRLYTPLAIGGGVVAWVVLCGSGMAPLLAAVLLTAVLLPIGVVLSRRSREMRTRTITLSSCRSGISGDTIEERRQQRQLDILSEALEDATFACRHNVIGRDGFERVWRAAYAQAGAIATSPSRSAE